MGTEKRCAKLRCNLWLNWHFGFASRSCRVDLWRWRWRPGDGGILQCTRRIHMFDGIGLKKPGIGVRR
ncbi:hypothetical protein KCP73_11240 [Salmonella enterica subsp. enterica]|nr:hypothetical protein KCP73_11240 [Salmonella enterica subsp. enterica]